MGTFRVIHLNVSWGRGQGWLNSRSRWSLKVSYWFRVVGQIVFSVKAEKYKVGIQLTDRANIARVGGGWGSQRLPQIPARHSDSETPLLLGRGCRVPLVLHRLGPEGMVI